MFYWHIDLKQIFGKWSININLVAEMCNTCSIKQVLFLLITLKPNTNSGWTGYYDKNTLPDD